MCVVVSARRKLCLSFITHVFNVHTATDCVKANTIKMCSSAERLPHVRNDDVRRTSYVVQTPDLCVSVYRSVGVLAEHKTIATT